MDFANKKLMLLFNVGGTDVYLTEAMLATWILMAVVLVVALILRLRILGFRDVPAGLQNILESLVEGMDGLTANMIGRPSDGYSAYFFGVFGFILLSNYSGMLRLRSPTTDLAATVALALCTFLITHIMGISKQGKEYFKAYLSPIPLFLPLNVVGELAKPVSLSFRLFGNVLGGTIILGMVYKMLPLPLQLLLPTVFHFYFDLFSGGLQAFIFTVLSMTFIQQKIAAPDGSLN